MNYSVDLCHNKFMEEHKPLLAFHENCDYESWRAAVKEKLTEILGDMPEEKVDPELKIEWEKEHETFVEYRFVFNSEELVQVVCHLWVPKNVPKPCPVVICLQGHSTGMHISMGRPVYEGDEELIAGGDRDFAVQIIKEGYAALILEQRGFGERKSPAQLAFTPNADCTCYHPAMAALLIGRTMIGERVWDISRTIDVLDAFPMIDKERIALIGNSGGGTATYYAACMEERIKIAMPSCSVCTYRHSITPRRHCACNYLPGIAKYVDMGDLSCLIAPRKLVMVSGELDHGFTIDGARETYATIEKVYAKAGAPDQCRFVVGEEGHRFYANPSWDVFRELSGWDK